VSKTIAGQPQEVNIILWWKKMFNLKECILKHQKKVIILLLINAFTLWLLTIATTHIYKIPPDPFYYAKQLPIFYWIGMMLICITLILSLYGQPLPKPKKHEFTEIIFIIILILYLFGTPSFIYTNPRFMDVYGVSYIVDRVIEAGGAHIRYAGLMYQTEFQGSILLFSMFSECTGINILVVSKYYPIYLMFIISILIYGISRKISSKYCLFAPIAYLSLAWVQEYHLAPQSHVLILSILLLFLLVILLTGKDTHNDLNNKLLIIIVWFAICISHAVTPILNLISLFFLFFSYIFLKYSSLFTKKNLLEGISTKMESLSALLILFVTVYIAYILYASDFIFARVISTMKATINRMQYGETFVVVNRAVTTPTQSYLFCYYVRWYIIIGTMVFGILSIFYLFLKNRDRTSNFVISSLFIGYSLLGLYLIISGYNVYGSDRSFIFLLIPFSILCSMVLHTELKLKGNTYKIIASKIFRIFKISLVLFIITAMSLLPITRYGTDPYEFVSESHYAGREFGSRHPISDSLTFTNFSYNHIELKQQRGEEYINSFNSNNLNRIYDSGQCKIHQKRT
jgi:hypothetical protein